MDVISYSYGLKNIDTTRLLSSVHDYPGFTTIQCSRLSRVHDYPGFTTIQCSRLSRVHYYPVFTTIQGSRLSSVHDYPGFTTIQGSPLSSVHHYPGFTTIQCSPLFRVHHYRFFKFPIQSLYVFRLDITRQLSVCKTLYSFLNVQFGLHQMTEHTYVCTLIFIVLLLTLPTG